MVLNLMIIGLMVLITVVGGCYVAVEEKKEKKETTQEIWEW